MKVRMHITISTEIPDKYVAEFLIELSRRLKEARVQVDEEGNVTVSVPAEEKEPEDAEEGVG